MFASLPMYDRPETAAAHDRLWDLIRDGLRAQGVAAPDRLDRMTGHMEGWARADLVLGQMCNLPYRARFRDRVTLIGAADYGLPDAPAGYYYSVFVVRADDPATDPAACGAARFAYNEGLSHSGWGAPQAWAAARGFAFAASLHTGAHLASARAVADGRADIAAIDAVTWAMLLRWEPAARALRVIGRTDVAPGQSFVTAPGRDPAPYRAAIAAAIAGLSPADKAMLGLRGIAALPVSAYDLPIPALPEASAAFRST